MEMNDQYRMWAIENKYLKRVHNLNSFLHA